MPSDAGGLLNGSFLAGFVGDNPYFQAGFGLMGVGVGFTALRKGLTLGTIALQRRMLVSLEIPIRDPAYSWFLAWMAHQTMSQARQRSSRWMRSDQLSVATTIVKQRNGSLSASFDLIAGPGTHWFKYRGAWMQVKRERETRAVQQDGIPWETVKLTALSRDRQLFPRLLAEAQSLAIQDQEGKLVIHTPRGIEWSPFGLPRRKRPLQSVVLAPGLSEKIQADVKAFLNRRKWYADRGIPYRRGYLLYGPPGSGKSSFIQALAGSISYDISVLNLSERGLGDDKFNHLLSNAPERSFILIEDIDAAFNKRVQTSEDGYQSSVTFSGFLNALDGVASGEERIVFMTTNHVERLDPALIRPGRVDLMELVDDALPTQARTLFSRFYEGGSTVAADELEKLGQALERLVETKMQMNQRISMAALQGLFIQCAPREAVEACEVLFVSR